MAKTAVVILNWNGVGLLEKFLPSVVMHSQAVADIYVADNCSSDASVAFLEKAYPQVRVIRLDQNYGFAGGYNRALAQVDADYYVLLNSDVEVTAGWIEPIIALMDKSPEVAACQPKIRAYHQPSEFEYAGAAGGFIDKWGYPFCRGRIFHVFEKDESQYDNACEIFWASGAALFVRARLYRETGGLDEDFFAHMEEIDLCWRLKNHGYKIWFHPASLVYHVGGGTLLMGSPRKTYLNFRNNLQLMSKNLPVGKFLPLIFLRLVLDGIAAISFLPNKNGWGNFWAVFRAHWSYYFLLPRIMKKRRSIPKRKVSCIYKRSVVFAFYARGIRKFSDLKGTFSS